jgi:hypothetical protein
MSTLTDADNRRTMIKLAEVSGKLRDAFALAQQALEQIRSAKQALNEKHFRQALSRSISRPYESDTLRQKDQLILVRTQQFLRLQYLGPWLQLAELIKEIAYLIVTSASLEEQAGKRMNPEQLAEFGAPYERLMQTNLPLLSLHEAWAAAQDPELLDLGKEALVELYLLCVNGCDDPAGGIKPPSSPGLSLIKIGDSYYTRDANLDWTLGGCSFTTYLGNSLCRAYQELLRVVDLTFLLDAYGRVNIRQFETRKEEAEAIEDASERQVRLAQIEEQFRTLEIDFLGKLQLVEKRLETSHAFMREGRFFMSLHRDRARFLQPVDARHNGRLEWLIAMFNLVQGTCLVQFEQKRLAAFEARRETKYEPLRQQLSERIVRQSAEQDDPRVRFLRRLEECDPIGNLDLSVDLRPQALTDA